MLNKFDLRFADFLQDEGCVGLDECEKRYKKSQSTLKRCVYRINNYLPMHLSFIIENNQVYSRINRIDYENLCIELKLKDYSTVLGERILLILFSGFFNGKINLTKLYEDIGLSQTTKKKDSRKMKEELQKMNLFVVNHYRKGIEITGSEDNYRNYIALKLSNIIELDKEDDLKARKANTPIQKLVYHSFIEKLKEIHDETKPFIQDLLDERQLSVDYASKKFLYIYYALATFRIKREYFIQDYSVETVEVPKFSLFNHPLESKYMDYVIASLNYKEPLRFPKNKVIEQLTYFFMSIVNNDYGIKIYTEKEFFHALYAYIYKCKILNDLGYSFYDHKLERTYIELEDLYSLIKRKIKNRQKDFPVQFTRYQLSVLCLIIETFISRNRVAGMGRKRIIVITNSSSEKVHYFEEKLKQFIEFEIIDYATINELHKLEDIEYDEIIVFSSRIQALLLEHNYKSLRINFYVKSEDVKLLIDAGFTSNQSTKLIAKEIIQQLKGKTEQEKNSVLKTEYKDYFL